MKLNNSGKLILFIYMMIITIMCIFFLPHTINDVVVSSQRVPHYVPKYTVYKPIWYSYNNDNGDISMIDAKRLLIQLFITSTIAGTGIVIFK